MATFKQATFGTISHGTLRTVDMLNAFADELETQMFRNGEWFSSPEHFSDRDRLVALHGEALDLFNDDATDVTDEDAALEVIEQLQAALQWFAPAYGYFGAHAGDGSDFGFWMCQEALDEFDGLRVTDCADIPADYSGEVLHINERGSLALYVATNGELSEVWSIV